jgi:hypothetical protein
VERHHRPKRGLCRLLKSLEPSLHLRSVGSAHPCQESGNDFEDNDRPLPKHHHSSDQRTGQPRCAQLIAKTWKVLAETRRTQQGMSPVWPSHEVVTGLRKLTSRVSPSGKSVSGPRLIQEFSLELFFPRARECSREWAQPERLPPLHSPGARA